MTQRIHYFLIKEGRLHPNEYRFTPHRSTSDSVSKVIEMITANKDAGRNTCVILLEVKSVFNNKAWWPAVLYELGEAKYPETSLNWLKIILTTERSAS